MSSVKGGVIEEQEITISGSGKYRAMDLENAKGELQIPGSGSVTIDVSDYLKAHISGCGDVRYIGSPTVDKTATGSG